ncbi:MAG: hypothetical protein H0W02_16940 [Ktedonobacteraceae bacterium]|nr:hypothetical protein [Ktedonobacteraceae bacterium]
MRFSPRSKWSILLLSFVALTTIVGGFFAFGAINSHTKAYAASRSVGNPTTYQITRRGTTSFTQAAPGHDGVQSPELVTARGGPFGHQAFKSSQVKTASVPTVASSNVASSHPELVKSFDGINHRQQRLANGGNQFSLEPPDQGLCVGNGFVFESVNDALSIYDYSGKTVKAVTALNAFYGYPPSINRTTHVFGPELTDPSCYFDKATQRWFHVVLTLETDPATGGFTGINHLDLAVSQTADPTGTYTIYSISTTDNAGTSDHHCRQGFCLGDYPHIGADAHGFYITTNEYGFAAGEFHAAQIYALSKAALAANAATVAVTQFDTLGAVNTSTNALEAGFTVWPATSPDTQFAKGQGGTEYFMSSDAATEVGGNGASRNLIVWAITNTQSLGTATPALTLSNTVLTVNAYSIPPQSTQKVGSTPLRDCLNNPKCSTFLNGEPDPFTEVQSTPDSNDTRMQQVTYAAGKLWGALDTSLTVGGKNLAGIEWFIVKPSVPSHSVTARLLKQGYLGLANTNLTYPAIGVTASGKGVMAFSLMGPHNFPSAAYASIDAAHGTGAVHIAAAGRGPDDGFTGYKYYGNGTTRARWGDYGAAVPVGNSVWMASEYIGQTCTLAQYEAGFTTQFGSCNGTRTALANWDTRISNVEVG